MNTLNLKKKKIIHNIFITLSHYICKDMFCSPSPKSMGTWPSEPHIINL